MSRPVLTPRQCQIARLIAEEGLSRKEVAARLGIATRTINAHMGTTQQPGLLARIGGHSMRDIIIWWYRDGGKAICTPEPSP